MQGIFIHETGSDLGGKGFHVKHPESKKLDAVTHIQTKVISETSSPKCMNFLNIAKTTPIIRGKDSYN